MDVDLKQILDTCGYPPLWSRPNNFESLVHIILEQQVSLASALAALNKLREKITDIIPENFLALTGDELKACYFSRQKAHYVRLLAEAFIREELDLTQLKTLPNDDIRTILSKHKGIGNWTIDIYLIFVLQRANIFPTGDLAAVNALKRLKNMPPGTTHNDMIAKANQWAPYQTIATMMLWHFYLSSPAKKLPGKRENK